MRTKYNIAFIYMFAVAALTGCSSNDDSFPLYIYEICISIENKAGNDKLENLPYNDYTKVEGHPPYYGDIYEVRSDTYKITVIQPEKLKEELAVYSLRIMKNDGDKDLLILNTGAATYHSPKYRPLEFNFILTCPLLFGDDAEHTVTTNWDLQGNTHNCVSIVIDGKSYTEWQDPEFGRRIFLIVCDD